MTITRRLARVAILLALVVLGCGEVTTAPLQLTDGGPAGDTSATPDVGVARDGASPSETSDVGGVDQQVVPSCIGGDADATGFAYNPGCDGGSTLPTSCHAGCTLDGAHFVGCAWDPRADGGVVVCHASCGECP